MYRHNARRRSIEELRRKNIDRFIGEKPDDQTVDNINSLVEDTLTKYVDNKIITDYEITRVKTLWESWSFQNKVLWVILHTIFGFITHWYLRKKLQSEQEVAAMCQCETYGDDCEHCKTKKLPSVIMERAPKQKILITCNIRPSVPITTISLEMPDKEDV